LLLAAQEEGELGGQTFLSNEGYRIVQTYVRIPGLHVSPGCPPNQQFTFCWTIRFCTTLGIGIYTLAFAVGTADGVERKGLSGATIFGCAIENRSAIIPIKGAIKIAIIAAHILFTSSFLARIACLVLGLLK
jgi:hypothetical protein